jgi:rod shape-determining protein MreD
MKFLRFPAVILVALLAELLLPRYVAGFFRYFDFMLIVVVFNSVNRSRIGATLVGTASGLTQDAFTGIVGVNGFSKTVVAWLASSFYQRFMIDTALTQLVVLAAATWIDAGITIGLRAALFGIPAGAVFPDLLIRTGCNAFGGVLLMRLAVLFFRRLSAGRMRGRGVSRLSR